ncbi:MAG TPA: large conductance mechanosensitive channel protein MscL [Thermomicrobiales bacterium]|nr:large conductance mechanosensitive channel protein MscL [Thermomicrobiales bacterium]
MKSWASEFKEFIMQGNVVSLAVAVVVGAAFGALVNSLVSDMITPLIAAFGGQPDFSDLSFTINGSKFMYGNFINAVVSFLIIALVIFIFVVKPMNSLMEKMKTAEPEDPALTKCPYCMTDVSIEATRCPACTSELKPAV